MKKITEFLGVVCLTTLLMPLSDNIKENNLLVEQSEKDPFFQNSAGMLS